MDLTKIFSWLLNMSMTASIVILVVLAARLLLKRAPRKYLCVLWLVPLFRLLCPVSFSAEFSLFGVAAPPVVSGTMEYIPSSLERQTAAMGGQQTVVDSVLRAEAERLAVDPVGIVMKIGFVLWLIGALVLLGYGVLSMLRLRRRIRTAVRSEPGVWHTEIPTAFVWGYFYPCIYLPFGLSEAEEKLVLAHEQAHITRQDQFLRLFMYFALCLHWFNPLVWLMFRVSSRDVELACDEHVLEHAQTDLRADYAQALLRQAGGRVLPLSPLSFGTGDIRCRVTEILRFRNSATWLTPAALLAVTVLGLTLTANPINDQTHALYGSLYDTGRNSFYCSLQTPPCDYAVGRSGRLYHSEWHYLAGRGWKPLGYLEAYTSEDDFRDWFPSGSAEQLQKEIDAFQRSNREIWTADCAEGLDYMLFRQKDGTDWIAWCDLNGGTPRIEQLFRLTRIEGTYIDDEYIGLPGNHEPTCTFFYEYAAVDVLDLISEELGEYPADLKVRGMRVENEIGLVCELYRFESESAGVWGVLQYWLEGENGKFYNRGEVWRFHGIDYWSMDDPGPHQIEVLKMVDTFNQTTQLLDVVYERIEADTDYDQ